MEVFPVEIVEKTARRKTHLWNPGQIWKSLNIFIRDEPFTIGWLEQLVSNIFNLSVPLKIKVCHQLEFECIIGEYE